MRKYLISASAFFALSLCAICPATFAQSSFGLGQINPWGTNYLKRGEPSLPTSAWQNSDAEILKRLLNGVQPYNLTPLQRDLLRRTLLSPARAPAGEGADALLSIRAKLIYELGEAAAASDLMGRIETLPDRLNPEHLEADLKMALGQEARVCSSLINSPKEGSFWARTRVVCAVLTGDSALSELTLEFAAMQGIRDDWLVRAVLYQASPDTSAPTARFDSGVNLALSLYLDLPTPLNAVSARRKELAAILSARDSIPSDVRASAARIAYDANLILDRSYRLAYDALAKDLLDSRPKPRPRVGQSDAATPDTSTREGPATLQTGQTDAGGTSPKPSPSFFPRNARQKALMVVADKEATEPEKIASVIDALQRTKGRHQDFKITADLFADFLRKVQITDVKGAQYLDLARAAFAIDDVATAKRFLTAEAKNREDRIRESKTAFSVPISPVNIGQIDPNGRLNQTLPTRLPANPATISTNSNAMSQQLIKHLEARAFENARLIAIMHLREGPSNVPEDTAKTLLETAKTSAQRKSAGQVFLLWQILGLDVPLDALDLITQQAGAPLQPSQTGRLLALSNSLQRNAMAEATLRIQSFLNNRPSDLHPIVLIEVFNALAEINSQDVREDLLLQASNFWKEAG